MYAKALLGQKFESAHLARAAEDILTWWRENADWSDAMMQTDWMTAVRMSLIAGDPAWTLNLLDEARLLNFHKSEAQRLAGIACAAVDGQPIRDAALRKQVDERFDVVRSPKWRGRGAVGEPFHDVRFEWAVIRYLYFIATDRTIAWSAVIQSVSR